MYLSNLRGDVIPAYPRAFVGHLTLLGFGDTSPVCAAGAEETPLVGWQRLGTQRGRVPGKLWLPCSASIYSRNTPTDHRLDDGCHILNSFLHILGLCMATEGLAHL